MINSTIYKAMQSFAGIAKSWKPKLMAIILSVMLSACAEPGAECFEADDFGQWLDRTIQVKSNKLVTDTGIDVVDGEEVHFEIGGVIDVCPSSRKDLRANPYFSSDPDNHRIILREKDGTILDPDPAVAPWAPTPGPVTLPTDPGYIAWETYINDPGVEDHEACNEYIGLTKDDYVYDSAASAFASRDEKNNARLINANCNEWQYTGIYVERDDKLSITTEGSYFDMTGEQKGGRGLYAYISPSLPPAGISLAGASPSDPEHDFFYGEYSDEPNITGSSTTTVADRIKDDVKRAQRASAAAAATNEVRFFELYDNGTVGKGGGYYGYPTASGHLFLKYARNANARYASDAGSLTERQSPWKGVYAWDHTSAPPFRDSCQRCYHGYILASCLPFLATPGAFYYPACIAAWQTGCAVSGHLDQAEEYLNNRWSSVGVNVTGNKCREPDGHPTSVVRHAGILDYVTPADYYDGHSGLGQDHWVDNQYNGKGGDAYLGFNPNMGGYDIQITKGCPGVFGKYLEYSIESPELTKRTSAQRDPDGCIPAATGTPPTPGMVGAPDSHEPCRESGRVDPSTGNLIQSDSFDIAAVTFDSADWRTTQGIHSTTVTTGGRLYFKMNDNRTSSRLENDGTFTEFAGGYIGDNVGEYSVRVKTLNVDHGFSNFTQILIDPVRETLFGYCRSVDNPSTAIDESISDRHLNESLCNAKYHAVMGDSYIEGASERLYNRLLVNPDTGASTALVKTMRAALVLYIVIFGLAFISGMIESPKEKMIKQLMIIVLIVTMMGPGSWTFFNNYFFSIFIDGMDSIIVAMTGQFNNVAGTVPSGVGGATVMLDPLTGDALTTPAVDTGAGISAGSEVGISDNPFTFADMTLSQFFSKATWAKLGALIFTSPVGFLYFAILVGGMVLFIVALIKGLIVYLLSMVGIAILVAVAPIFIIFLLFERTRSFFMDWALNLLNFFLQPIMVLVVLSIFNIFVYTIIYEILQYRVCWDVVYNLTINPLDILPNIDMPLFSYYLPTEVSPSVAESGTTSGFLDSMKTIPMAFFMMLIYLILVTSMLKLIAFMESIAAHITTGIKSLAMSQIAEATLAKAVNVGVAIYTMGVSAAKQAAAKAAIKAATDSAKAAAKTKR